MPGFNWWLIKKACTPFVTSLLSCSGTGWTSTTGRAGRWLEQSWSGRAGRRPWSGWWERPSQSSEGFLEPVWQQWSSVLSSSSCSASSHSASFVKPIISTVLLKTINTIKQELCWFTCLFPVLNIHKTHYEVIFARPRSQRKTMWSPGVSSAHLLVLISFLSTKAACKIWGGPGGCHSLDGWGTRESSASPSPPSFSLPLPPPSARQAVGWCRCNRSWSPSDSLVSWRRSEGWRSWSTSSRL